MGQLLWAEHCANLRGKTQFSLRQVIKEDAFLEFLSKACLRVLSSSQVLEYFAFSAMTFQHKAMHVYFLNHFKISYIFHDILPFNAS